MRSARVSCRAARTLYARTLRSPTRTARFSTKTAVANSDTPSPVAGVAWGVSLVVSIFLKRTLEPAAWSCE